MKNKSITISIIILNYKNVELTAECIDEILNSFHLTEFNPEIIVVDNSSDETLDQLKNILPPGIKIIATEKNLGFAKANNIGIKQSNGEYILLLNNDVFINTKSIETGIEYLTTHNDVGIWAPKLIGKDGELQISCARFPSISGVIGEYLFGKLLDWYKDVQDWKNPTKVDTVVGAFMLMHKSLLEQTGLLNEDFFFNVEDVEFCKRVSLKNFNVIFDPRCTVIHLGGASQPYDWINDPFMHKNRILYFRLTHGVIASLIVSLIIKLGLLLRRLKA